MNKIARLILALPILIGSVSSVTSCSNKNETKYILRIINSDDYIYLHDDNDPESLPDLVDQFIEYATTVGGYEPGTVGVVYDTSDTNETIYSELLTGKATYDLVNVSDYMAQKIVSQQLAVPLDKSKLDNYTTYASSEIKSRLDNIESIQTVFDKELGKWVKKSVKLGDYAVGYMWGTLGLLFNPYYFQYDDNEVRTDMISYDAIWQSKYKGAASIKNSMRDTYAVGLLHTFDDDFNALRLQYENGLITKEQYQEEFSKIFNKCDETTVNKVGAELDTLKSNVFGLEVDSGKQDIVTQKIGINMAWSGDAVYSMDQAEDGLRVGENQVELCYSVPENGSNLWFDAWLMPSTSRTAEQADLAHMFLNFISDPVNAAQNMNYTGYTSFIAGDPIIELVRDWYDVRTDEIYQEVEVEKYTYEYYSIYSVSSSDFTCLDYSDCMKTEVGEKPTHDPTRDDEALYYFVPYIDDEGVLIEEPETLEDLLNQNNKVLLFDENGDVTDVQKTYGDLLIVNDAESAEGIEVVDLTYFFNGTNIEYDADDLIFYSDCYLPFTYEDEFGNEVQNISVGRQFFCQYPNEETITRCAVMSDYGENNKLVMKMWENFKSDPLPTGSIIIFVIIIAIILFLLGVALVNIIIKKRLHNKRVKNNK